MIYYNSQRINNLNQKLKNNDELYQFSITFIGQCFKQVIKNGNEDRQTRQE